MKGITIREDELSNDIVVVSANRAKRPHVQTKGAHKKIKTCPFCPGNEKMTPPTIMQFGAPAWSVRCFNNKFPVFSGKQGVHEVVVDTSLHSASMSDLPVEQIAKLLRAYSARSDWMLSRGGMKCVLVCKNSGMSAGASLSHPHSQIFGMPFTPPRVSGELAMIHKYRKEHGRCILCDEARRAAGKRKIMETENFVVIAPRAPRWQYESRIIPKMHAGRLCELDMADMAGVLKKLVSAYNLLLGKPVDYNYYIRSAPKGDKSLHLHLDFFPRLGVHAGLEEGAGVFINQVSPEKAAELLRKNLL